MALQTQLDSFTPKTTEGRNLLAEAKRLKNALAARNKKLREADSQAVMYGVGAPLVGGVAAAVVDVATPRVIASAPNSLLIGILAAAWSVYDDDPSIAGVAGGMLAPHAYLSAVAAVASMTAQA